jgi:hypothetical protein
MIHGITFQHLPLPQVLAGLLTYTAATIELMALDPGILAASLTAVATIKISWHNLLSEDFDHAKLIII